ncbi:nucleotidyltransferase-like protein [Solibacillus sp. FSL H8-0538]|uniref:nucleotidyltransferase-like protein n=1 Tax=Solibacillus sp. FSL H8-0538 TaxID=2921400 RepID=UPI0030FBEE60
MEHILRPIYQERASQPDTLGVILINKREDAANITDTFDAVLLIVVKDAEHPIYSKHYMYGDSKMVMHILTEERLRKWIFIGSNKRLVDWIFYGKIMFDRNEFLFKLRSELQEFPFFGRKLKTGIQYSKLIRRYLEGKELFENGHHLDAYNHVVASLHHLGRLSIIDSGLYPEVTVWAQVKKIEPAIYKLYEELIMSNESLEKRLELLFLANEFLINSRTHDGAQHILETMLGQSTWTIQELHDHPELSYYSVDLEVFVEYLIDKGYIIMEPVIAKNESVFHRHYCVDKQFVESEYGL